MTTVNVGPTVPEPTHDLALEDVLSNKYGFMFDFGSQSWREVPQSMPSSSFNYEQKQFVSGRGRNHYHTDPMGYTEGKDIWSMTDQRLHTGLQWQFAKGLRNADSSLPGSMSWQTLTGTQRYVYIPFTASASYSAAYAYLWVRRVGTPGTLTLELRLDSDDSVLKTVTKTAADFTDILSEFRQFAFSSVQSLTSSTVYRVAVYGASTDDASNYWQVGTDASGTSSKKSANGSTWASATFSMYYRVTDADVARKFHPFVLEGANYVVDQKDAAVNSQLYINGDRGTATSATGTTLVCSGKSWVADRWIGAKVRIIDGTGDGQTRDITDNDGTSVTVATWTINPDNTSKFIIYYTEWWTEITGHGFTYVKGPPAIVDKYAYFPQGTGTALRYMTVNASSYTFGAGHTSSKLDGLIAFTTATGGMQLVGYKAGSANLYTMATVTTGGTFTAGRVVGTTDYRITSLSVDNGELVVGKEDGLYSYSNTRVIKRNASMDAVPVSSNCSVMATFGGALWLSWNYSTQMVQGPTQVDREAYYLGYEHLSQNMRGIPSAYTPVIGWLFKATDADTGTSSVMAWNGFGWHPVFRAPRAGARVRNCFWVGGLNTRGRLWIDCAGDMVYIEFPSNGATPSKDTACRFMHEGVLETGTIDANQRDYYKYFREITAVSENLASAGNTVTVQYQTDNSVGTTTWTTAGTLNGSPFDNVRIDAGGVFQIRLRLIFNNTSNSSPGILHSFTVPGSIADPQRYQWEARITVGDDRTTKTGAMDHDPDTLDVWLKDAAARKLKLTTYSNKSSMHAKTVIIENHTASMDYNEQGKWEGVIWLTLKEP